MTKLRKFSSQQSPAAHIWLVVAYSANVATCHTQEVTRLGSLYTDSIFALFVKLVACSLFYQSSSILSENCTYPSCRTSLASFLGCPIFSLCCKTVFNLVPIF